MSKKVLWLVINSDNTSDGISSKLLGETDSGITFVESFGLQWQI